jgi:hypothetical protein
MFIMILPSGTQTFVTRDGAHNICSSPTSRVSITRKPRGPMGQHVITVTDAEYGDACEIIGPPSDDLAEFRSYARKES